MEGNQPDFIVSTPTKLGNEKTVWTKVGIGYKSKYGDMINITLNALPVNGKLLVKKFVSKETWQRVTEEKIKSPLYLK